MTVGVVPIHSQYLDVLPVNDNDNDSKTEESNQESNQVEVEAESISNPVSNLNDVQDENLQEDPTCHDCDAESAAHTTTAEPLSRRAARKRKAQTIKATLCNRTAIGETCPLTACKFTHDLDAYLASKPADLSGTCVHLESMGSCPHGWKCRFATSHPSEMPSRPLKENNAMNQLSRENLTLLRQRKYDFKKSDEVIQRVNQAREQIRTMRESDPSLESIPLFSVDTSLDHPRERRVLNWTNKLILAPLTTVGNLPFRRVCKKLGADVTVGEMAMAHQLLQGFPSEWALVKRHPSEDIFGVQLCGSRVDNLTRAAQLIEETCQVDFIDLNIGCPIDIVYQKGMGSALMDRVNRLEDILVGMRNVITTPLTLKMRMGVFDNKYTAHTLIPKAISWGVDAITLHGRTREQRYSKNAHWDYIAQCASVMRSSTSDLPFIGNGDIYTFLDYEHALAQSCTTVMLARGALIKPWLFTECHERRHWDISARERFDLLRDYTRYGMEHFGTDDAGIEKTRRFLLEWMSFLHRYVPVGLLEYGYKPCLTDRIPKYNGRCELETMLGSPDPSDWIKLSERLLGPVPDQFQFTPKHKANAYQASG